MHASLLAFIQGLDSLQHYLQALDLEGELLGKRVSSNPPSEAEALLLQLQNHLAQPASKRRFDYNSIIVSLYGFFERFVEALLRASAETFNKIVPQYQQLPEQIVKRHIELSFILINRIEQTRYKSGTTTSEIVSNLHTCLSGNTTYKINAEAFAYHSANFRTDSIDEAFSKLGILNTSQKVKESQRFLEYLRGLDPVRDPKSVTFQEAFTFINTLAERRNDVAHGINADILSNNILLEYIDFFYAYGHALYDVVRNEFLQYVAKYQAIHIGQAITVINSCVVCLSLEQVGVKLGDILIAKTPNDIFFEGEIEEIQIDGVSHLEVEPCPGINVGLKVSFKAKENQSFMILPQHLKYF